MNITHILFLIFAATILLKLINNQRAKSFQKLMSKIDPAETRQLKAKGLALFPKNYHLINNVLTLLMYASFIGGIVSFFV